MSRLVRVPRQTESGPVPAGGVFGAARGGQLQAPRTADNYLERIAKYFPGEVIAFFIVINAILAQAAKAGGAEAIMAGLPVTMVALGALAVSTVLVPLFIWYVREDGDAWLTHAIVSTLVFPFWAYALGAVAFSNHWDGNLAAILLVTVTIVSGLVTPRVPKARRDEQSASPAPQRTERPQLDLITPTPA
jgi:hypothetical protein